MDEKLNSDHKEKRKFRSLILNSILVVVSIVVTLIIAEILLHLFLPVRYPLTSHWVRIWRYHPVVGWSSIPHAFFQMERITNGRGLRGREISYSRTPRKSRILISGDSFAFGYGLNESKKCFHEIMMGRFLTDTEIVNMGCSGYGTDQELLSYEIEGYRYSPDLVILMFYPNDFTENLLCYDNGLIRPTFTVDGDNTLILRNVPVPMTNGWGKEWVQPSTFRERLFLKSRIFNLWQQGRIALLDKPTIAYDVFPTKEFIAKSGVTMAILREFNEACKRRGSRFMIVTLPYMSMIEDDEWENLKHVYGLTDEERFEPYEQFFDPLVNEGIPVLHLSGPLYRLSRTGIKMMADAHRHLNEEGHRYVARVLSEFIKGKELLQKKTR